jgi:DNA-binding CsgD family transcriptional regulator
MNGKMKINEWIDQIPISIEKCGFFSIPTSFLDLFQASIYWKDKNGLYLGRNEYAAKTMVMQKFEDKTDKDRIVGKTDFDLFDQKTAENFRRHDLEVLSNVKNTLQVIEDAFLPEGQIIQQISIKFPITNEFGDVILLGYTIPDNNLDKNKPNNFLFYLKSIKNQLLSFLGSPTKNSLFLFTKALYNLALNCNLLNCLKQIIILSDRELQTLCLSARGFTAKKIALILGISPRTAEIYIANIKVKLNIYTQAEIIDWFWQLIFEINNLEL